MQLIIVFFQMQYFIIYNFSFSRLTNEKCSCAICLAMLVKKKKIMTCERICFEILAQMNKMDIEVKDMFKDHNRFLNLMLDSKH